MINVSTITIKIGKLVNPSTYSRLNGDPTSLAFTVRVMLDS